MTKEITTIEQKAHPKSTLYNSGSIRTKVVRATWNMSTSGGNPDKAVAGDIVVLAKDLDPSLTIADIAMKNTALTTGVIKLGLRNSPQGGKEVSTMVDNCIADNLSVVSASNASIFPIEITGKTLAELLGKKTNELMGVDLILKVGTAPTVAGTASFKIEFSEL